MAYECLKEYPAPGLFFQISCTILTCDTDYLVPLNLKYQVGQQTRHQILLLQTVTGTLSNFTHRRKSMNAKPETKIHSRKNWNTPAKIIIIQKKS